MSLVLSAAGVLVGVLWCGWVVRRFRTTARAWWLVVPIPVAWFVLAFFVKAPESIERVVQAASIGALGPWLIQSHRESKARRQVINDAEARIRAGLEDPPYPAHPV